MDIKLYVFPGGDGLSSVSPPCVRVQLLLSRAGVDFDMVYAKSFAEARKVSVTGRLPAIDIGGKRCSDSTVILDELEARIPQTRVTPEDPTAQMRDRLWEHYFNDHVYWLGYYMRWVHPDNHKLFVDAMLARAPFVLKLMAPPVMRRSTRNRSQQVGIRGKTPDEIMQAFERTFDMLETGLAGGPFLEGRDAPGRGDLASASMIAQAGFRGTMPNVEARLRERPALFDYTRSVFEACKTEVPRWLASSGQT